ncbi:GAF domain-containing protein [Funiculus sociatus GB2-A5]|uniref:histidine kinase n=2 Tax=Cyanophyceae TaxID=3028117 RepID=A0ABV0JJ44_9CYAN|nr:GAF domain-containing protein [Trichocoleus sp. FACHB-6]MBD1908624.1 GAF domain-containing protein [Trichocoleus sp. FACHB-832]MBD2063245.1 GAF domain-containing protein [Trichocoleus sp. FACHB-6]
MSAQSGMNINSSSTLNTAATGKQPYLVLIVEDDRLTRLQLRAMMEKEGYRVAEAKDGDQGLAEYIRLRPDIVLLDALMPTIDGFNCCTLLRKLPQGDRIPVLIITALEDSDSVDRAFAAGATDYITKPIHWAVLRQRVRRLLDASRATAELQQQNDRLRLMGNITQQIRQSLDLKEILQTTVAQVREFLQTDRVVIYRFLSDWSGSIEVESVDERYRPILGSKITDPCFNEKYINLYKQGRIKATTDVNNAGLSRCHLDLLTSFQVRANLVVPILQIEAIEDDLYNAANAQRKSIKYEQGSELHSSSPTPNSSKLWGLLVAHHCSSTRQWNELEIDCLSSLANQAAIAIQQSELYQQVQRLNSNLERQVQERTAQLQQALKFEAMLKRITDKVRDSLDESQILQTAVQELAIGLEVGYCGTALYNLEEATSTICQEYRTSLPSHHNYAVQMAAFTEIYSNLLQGQYLQFCQLDSKLTNPIPSHVAALACPIFDNQGVLGNLWLLHHQEYLFNELEIRLVQQVANQCAIAIRQARLYQATLVQVKELEKVNQLKDDFLSTVSHELRTPISNMKMAIEMLEDIIIQTNNSFGNPTPENPDNSQSLIYFEMLNDECEREINLINDLLQLQQVNAGLYPLERTDIELQHWIPYIIEPFEQRTKNQQQIFQVEISKELPILYSDSFSLERIITELVNNACKYTPPGEKITVAVREVAGMIQISVSNSGVEIPESELPRVFDQFYRIPSNDRWKHGGTGLGLALVQKLITYLGGSIQVESKLGNTCFLVELPIT